MDIRTIKELKKLENARILNTITNTEIDIKKVILLDVDVDKQEKLFILFNYDFETKYTEFLGGNFKEVNTVLKDWKIIQ